MSPLLEWLKKDVRTFKVPIENKNQKFDLSLDFRYVEGYQYKVLKVRVTEISPSGKETINEHELKLEDEDGEYIGEPDLSFLDFSVNPK